MDNDTLAPSHKLNTSQLITFVAFAAVLLAVPVSIYVLQQPTSTTSFAQSKDIGDVNNDGLVDLNDAATIRQAIQDDSYSQRADLTGDGMLNEQDIETFYTRYSLNH